MKTRKHSMILAAATLLAFLMGCAMSPGMAQTPMPGPGMMAKHQGSMEGMQGMGGRSSMMGGPHQVLAMAYHDNLATFAQALETQVTRSKTVDLDLARPAVAEMRRSFEQMRQHHQAQMKVMGDNPKPPMAGMPMSGMMHDMDTHHVAVDEHLTALEAEVSAGAPDPRSVSTHTAEILKQCAGMVGMSSKAKPHQMK